MAAICHEFHYLLANLYYYLTTTHLDYRCPILKISKYLFFLNKHLMLFLCGINTRKKLHNTPKVLCLPPGVSHDLFTFFKFCLKISSPIF